MTGSTKQPIDFKSAAFTHDIRFWVTHNCDTCGEGKGFKICHNDVFRDEGCSCGREKSVTEASWEDLADYYSQQTGSNVIAEMDKFWRFT